MIILAVIILLIAGAVGVHIKGENKVKIACVGDSITFGYGVSSRASNCYPALLQQKLGEGYEVGNFGVNGTTVQSFGDEPYIKTSKYISSREFDADILVFMMGTNDANTFNWRDADAFKAELCALLDSYMEGDKKPQVYLCTPSRSVIIDGLSAADVKAGVTGFDVQVDVIPVIGDVVKSVADERGYGLVDIYAVTAEHPEWVAKDGVHPNNEGAAAIAEAVYQAVK